MLVIALGVASVPDLARSVHTAYRPVVYPQEWDAVIDAVSVDGTPTVLSLPWQPLRRPTWAGDPAFLDPLPRAVPGTTLVSTALSVERGGTVVVVDDTPVDEVWATGRCRPTAFAGTASPTSSSGSGHPVRSRAATTVGGWSTRAPIPGVGRRTGRVTTTASRRCTRGQARMRRTAQ